MTEKVIDVFLEQEHIFNATIPHDLYADIQEGFVEAGLERPGASVRLIPVKDRIRYSYHVDGGLRPVPDTGEVFRCGSDCLLPMGKPVTKNSLASVRPIVFLLESPHVEEAKQQQPAAGSTGEMIQVHLVALHRLIDEVSRGSDELDGAPLILCNPCRYPASCLAETLRWSSWRDHVFDRIMGRWDIQQCFLDRLEAYNPRVIINACTGGQAQMETYWPVNDQFDALVKTPKPKGLVQQLIETKYGSEARYHSYRYVPETQLFSRGLPRRRATEHSVDIVEIDHPIRWLYQLKEYQENAQKRRLNPVNRSPRTR